MSPAHSRLKANSFGTRAKLMALLLLAIVPLCVLVAYGAIDRYQLLMASAQQQARHMAIVLSDRHEAIIENTRSILQSLGNDPSIRQRDWARCNLMLKNFHQFFLTNYSTFHVSTPDGNVVCSATPLSGKINVADREDFGQTLATGEFVMGKVIRSRTTGLTSVAARYPVRDAHNKIIAVITAQVSAVQFEVAALNTPIPAGGELLVMNGDQEILLHFADHGQEAGDIYPSNELWYGMRRQASGVIERSGSDGVPRIYGFARAVVDDSNWLYVAIGFPLDPIRSNVYKHLYQSSATALLIALLVLLTAWFGVERLVLRKVHVLVDTVTRLRNGESSARTGLEYGRDELCRIARAVDETAEELENAMNSLREQSVRDSLTTLYNRRYMEETLDRELQTAERRGWQLGIIMADIDHFKRFNDTYGHELGDEVLKAISQVMVEKVRGGDTVCRYGGEEFAIILPGTPSDIAVARAEALREAISKIRIRYGDTDIGTLTISCGVAIYPSMRITSNTLIRHADAALYEAKRNGRNRVVLASDTIV